MVKSIACDAGHGEGKPQPVLQIVVPAHSLFVGVVGIDDDLHRDPFSRSGSAFGLDLH
jgi:hypothetical protein